MMARVRSCRRALRQIGIDLSVAQWAALAIGTAVIGLVSLGIESIAPPVRGALLQGWVILAAGLVLARMNSSLRVQEKHREVAADTLGEISAWVGDNLKGGRWMLKSGSGPNAGYNWPDDDYSWRAPASPERLGLLVSRLGLQGFPVVSSIARAFHAFVFSCAEAVAEARKDTEGIDVRIGKEPICDSLEKLLPSLVLTLKIKATSSRTDPNWLRMMEFEAGRALGVNHFMARDQIMVFFMHALEGEFTGTSYPINDAVPLSVGGDPASIAAVLGG